jgi:mono/diheme cytochrome c family protein
MLAGMAMVMAGAAAQAQTPSAAPFPVEAVRKGAGIYSQNCSPCHGARMAEPGAAFDLRTFPRDEKGRFVTSVSRGKNAMPPWGDMLQREEIEALWAYVVAGERNSP